MQTLEDSRERQEAMKVRLRLKEEELTLLKKELQSKRNKLGMLIHAIKAHEKPI